MPDALFIHELFEATIKNIHNRYDDNIDPFRFPEAFKGSVSGCAADSKTRFSSRLGERGSFE